MILVAREGGRGLAGRKVRAGRLELATLYFSIAARDSGHPLYETQRPLLFVIEAFGFTDKMELKLHLAHSAIHL